MAYFYVLQTTDIKDFTCKELIEALDIDTSLFLQIVC